MKKDLHSQLVVLLLNRALIAHRNFKNSGVKSVTSIQNPKGKEKEYNYSMSVIFGEFVEFGLIFKPL